MTSQKNQHVPLAGSVFDRYRHVCVFYNSQDEEYRILLPFIKEGFDKGDKTFHIIDERNRPEHLRRLKEVGIDVTGAEGEGQARSRAGKTLICGRVGSISTPCSPWWKKC
jgi:hypothetical protein